MKLEQLLKILDVVKYKIIYNDDEYNRLDKKAEEVKKIITKYIKDQLNLRAEIVVAGSLAKRTMVKGESDIDIFIRLETDLSKDELKKLIINLGEDIFGRENIIIRYAEHPYIEAYYDKIKFSIVPSFKVDLGRWKSPVDRTYYHLLYVRDKLSKYRNLCHDVSILKMFLKKLGIYGAEIYTKGFSGYLCELLILYYGGFINLIKNVASNWKPPIVIDIEKAYGDSYNNVIKVFNAPLIVIDPVDKGRNVAAVVSLKTLTKFISACKALLDNPKLSFFDPDYAITPKRVSLPQDIHILGIKITHKAEIPDILFSQVERIKNKIKKHLQKNNFEVLKEVVFSNFIDTSLIIFLLPSLSIPKVYVRQGPYPYFPEEKKFIDKNREKFIWIDDDGRWKVLEIRQITDVRMLVSQILNYVKIPDLLRNANFNIMIDDELFNDKTISKWLKKLEYREDFWVDIT